MRPVPYCSRRTDRSGEPTRLDRCSRGVIAEFGKPGATFSMKQQFVEGDYAYILWEAETEDNVCELGTDTFVVRDGKIVTQSSARLRPRARNTPSFRETAQP